MVTPRRPDRSDQLDQAAAFDAIETGGRLVEQQQRGLRHERAGDLDEPLHAVRQRPRRDLRDVQETDEIERLPGAIHDRLLLGLLRRRM